METELAIHVQGLDRHFGDIHAVRDISFDVAQGEIFSLLGPNGAGKSTIISMLSCLLSPNQGDAWIFGHSILREPMEVRLAIGVVPQEIALYPDLSARENLSFWGKMYGLRGVRNSATGWMRCWTSLASPPGRKAKWPTTPAACSAG